jgi:class 3 adenylate cyclase/tetratricopeptide (TPR) repeat protein
MTETAQPVERRRRVSEIRTFLFVDVRGYSRFTVEHGDEAAARLVAKFAALAQEGVAARGGEVIELRGDEALAVFSSVRQALRAAVELQGRFVRESVAEPSLPLAVGIGLDAGEAVPVEGGYRGAALNLAARLCSLAGPGEVLASDGVVHLAQKIDGLAYAERGLVQLKGFAEPVKVIQIVPEADHGDVPEGVVASDEAAAGIQVEQRLPIGGFLGSLPSGALVARDQELGQILTAVDAVVGGAGRLVLLAGEPGAGKTRLAQEVTLTARNRGFLMATGICYEQRQAVPYYPFLDVVAALFGAASVSIRSQLAHRWPYLGRLLPEARIPGFVVGSDDQEEQERLFRAVTGFVQAMAEIVPVALLLDDLHWADGSSLGLLQHLARHTRADRILILGTYRDVEVGRQHPLERALRDLHREGLVERVAVRRMAQEGTAALIAAAFGEAEVSPEFAGLVHRHTEGNPFFTQEVLRALVERGDIYRENGRWTRKGTEEIEVPESVRSVVGERLSRLSERVQEVLYEASVLGQTFAFDDLQGIGDRPEQEVEEALEEATAAGLVRESEKDAYSFDHVLIQQALYAELSPRRRRRLHLAAAQALERSPEETRANRVAELAWHYLQGDDAARALPYAITAGDQAEVVFAHVEAEQRYRTALELARKLHDAEREVGLLERLGRVLSLTGRYDEALDLLQRVAEGYRQRGDLDAEASVVAQMLYIAGSRRALHEGLTLTTAFQERLPEGVVPSRGLVAFYTELSTVLRGLARHDEMLAAAERAVELARSLGDEHVLAHALGRLGMALGLLGRGEEARRVLEEAIPVLEREGDLTQLARAYDNLSGVYENRGDLAAAIRYRRLAGDVGEQLGDPQRTAFETSALGQLLIDDGAWEEARATLERALAAAGRSESPSSAAEAVDFLGWLSLLEGKLEEAAQHTERLIDLAEISDEPITGLCAQWLLLQRDLLEGRTDLAVTRYDAADVEAKVWPFLRVPFLAPLAEAHLELGQEELAEELLASSFAQLRGPNMRALLVYPLRARAKLLTRQRRWEEATDVLEELLTLSRSVPYPYHEALALYEYGIMNVQRGEPQQARGRLEEALMIFQRLGARPYIERTERALNELD